MYTHIALFMLMENQVNIDSRSSQASRFPEPLISPISMKNDVPLVRCKVRKRSLYVTNPMLLVCVVVLVSSYVWLNIALFVRSLCSLFDQNSIWISIIQYDFQLVDMVDGVV